MLHKDHELLLLLVNTILKDLDSNNYLMIVAALSCVARLANAEMVPVLHPRVVRLVTHGQELVRKKAVMALLLLEKISQ